MEDGSNAIEIQHTRKSIVTAQVIPEALPIELNEREQFVAGLREVADHIENTRGIVPPTPTFYIQANAGNFGDEIRTLGKSEKSSSSYEVRATRRFTGLTTIIVQVPHEGVCKKISKGVQKISKMVYPTVEPYETFVEEEVFEWECPESFLKPVEAADEMAREMEGA